MMGDVGNLTRVADERFPQWHPKYNKNEVLVHGHTHDVSQHNGGNAIHCGVDAWDYTPVSIDEVVYRLRNNGF
jgi:calcineurin-like phosphoesterase family protein